jgi:RNA recognition motif-containing protein
VFQVSKKIYVGNLPWSVDDSKLSELFSRHGEVISAKVIMDRETGRSRGFGFVEMDEASADEAISAMNGYEMDGRALRVNQAQERERNDRRGGGGGRGRW